MKYGWFKMNREIFTDEILCHNSEHLAVWCYLCANAVYKETQARFAGKLVTLQPGQLITGRKVIAQATKISEYKVQRILSFFESAQRIAQQTSNTNRLISILEREPAPETAQQSAQPLHSDCTTGAQQMHTIKKEEKEKNLNVNNYARSGARKSEPWKRGRESVFSSDASYDLDAWAKASFERLMNYERHTKDLPEESS